MTLKEELKSLLEEEKNANKKLVDIEKRRKEIDFELSKEQPDPLEKTFKKVK